MDTGFRDDIGIQAIAKVDRVDVVTVERKNPVSIGLARGELLWERHGIGGKRMGRREGVPFKIAVHYREEHLEEEIDRI